MNEYNRVISVSPSTSQSMPFEPYKSFYPVVRHGVIQNVTNSDILYFAVNNRIILLNCIEKKQLKFYGKMKDVEATMRQYGFIRCNRSYLVNAQHIRQATRTALVLSDGTTLSVGTNYGNALFDYFLKPDSRQPVNK